MTEERRAKQIESMLRDLAVWSGQFERSAMYPGAEVIDAAFSADRILVRGRENYYEPALKSPDVTYNNGDEVTVLYITGCEPIAISQSPSSGGGGGVGGWPFGDELTVDPTDADADYTTVALAAAAAAAGDCIRVGAGVHVIAADDIPVGVDLRGSGLGITILRCTNNVEGINFQGTNRCSDLTIENTYDVASATYAVKFEGADVECRDVRASVNNPTSSGYAWNPRSTTCKLINCEGYSTGGGDNDAVLGFGGNVDLVIEGGEFEGDDNDMDANGAGNTIALHNPRLVNGTIGITGVVQGHYTYNNDMIPGLRVENASGAGVSVGDLGYLDEAGEYKETTTAYDNVRWCVVLIGGANTADIYVARRGRVRVVLNGNCSVGDYLYTSTTAGQAQPQSYTRPELFAVALTANAGGAGGTCEALLLTGTSFIPVTSVVDVYSCASYSWPSDWRTTINGAPAGAVVTYNVPLTSGAENNLVPIMATAYGKVRLYNETRLDYALIDSVNIGANTITLTANAPAGWADTDVITARSQTTVEPAPGSYFFDIDLSSADNTLIPVLARTIYLDVTVKDTAAAQTICYVHEWATYGNAKVKAVPCYVVNQFAPRGVEVGLIQRRFTVANRGSGAATASNYLRIRGYDLAVP